MALDKITRGIIADDAIDATKIEANSIDSSELVDGSIDTSHLGNLQVTAAKVAADVATQAELDLKATKVELEAARQDITILALREAVTENRVAYTSTNSFIDQFQDDSGIGTETDTDRNASEYASTIPTTSAFTDDSNTLILLHMDGTNDATSGTGYTDSASANANSPHTILRTNTASTQPDLDTTTKKLGTASMFFGTGDGTTSSHGNSLSIADNADWDVFKDASDWTLEAWIYKTAAIPAGGNSEYEIFNQSKTDSTDVGGSWHFKITADEKLFFNVYQRQAAGGDLSVTGSTTLAENVWIHVACVRDGTTIRLYVNGVQDGTVAIPSGGNLVGTDLAGKVWISRRAYTSNYGYFYGYMDEMRMSKTCRYPSGTTFTPNAVLSPTGTMIGNANVPSAAQTKVSGVMLYKDATGTAAIGTGTEDLKIYFTCNGGTNWTEAASYTAVTPVFSTGIKMVKLGETTCTSGSDVRYKAVWANQVLSSKKTQLHGIGLNY